MDVCATMCVITTETMGLVYVTIGSCDVAFFNGLHRVFGLTYSRGGGYHFNVVFIWNLWGLWNLFQETIVGYRVAGLAT